jgi:preprotein translocase SecE subunit
VANKTIDRKKAGMARSRVGAASPKAANTKAARPAVGKDEEEAKLKASRGAASTEVLENDEEAEDLLDEDAEDSAEADTAAADEGEEEDDEETQPTRRRRKRETGLATVQPEDYSLGRAKKSFAPSNPLLRYFLSSYRELRQVTYPTWQDTRNWTIVVILVAGSIGALLGAFDFGMAKFVTWWLSLAAK